MRHCLCCYVFVLIAMAVVTPSVAMAPTHAARPRPFRQKDKRDWREIQKEIDNYVTVVPPLALGCERPGTRVDLVFKGVIGCPIEHWEHLRLTDGSRSILIDGLNDLRGHVAIGDERTALRYVRLLTSPETWFLWRRGQIEVEIIVPSEFAGIPNFGLHREGDLPATYRYCGSGAMGVVSPSDFKSGGFSHTTVTRTKKGFTVVRWIYSEPPGPLVSWRRSRSPSGTTERSCERSLPRGDPVPYPMPISKYQSLCDIVLPTDAEKTNCRVQ